MKTILTLEFFVLFLLSLISKGSNFFDSATLGGTIAQILIVLLLTYGTVKIGRESKNIPTDIFTFILAFFTSNGLLSIVNISNIILSLILAVIISLVIKNRPKVENVK